MLLISEACRADGIQVSIRECGGVELPFPCRREEREIEKEREFDSEMIEIRSRAAEWHIRLRMLSGGFLPLSSSAIIILDDGQLLFIFSSLFLLSNANLDPTRMFYAG